MNSLPQLPVDLYSPEQLSIVLLELRQHLVELRQATLRAKVSKKAESVEAPHFSALLTSLLHGVKVKLTDVEGLERMVKQLETLRNQAPTVHIVLSALPNRTVKRQFTDWFRANVHPATLMTFAARGDIGGGAVLQAGSHIYDFSFKETLLKNKPKIAELFAHVRQ